MSHHECINLPCQSSKLTTAGDRIQRLEALALVQSRLAEAELGLEEFMQLVVDELERLVGRAAVVLELVDGEDMVYRATSASLAAFKGLRIRRQGSLSGLCVERSELLVCDDTRLDPRVDAQACERTGVRSMICCPLIWRGEATGALKISSDVPNRFEDQDVHALRLLASAFASEMGKQLRHEQTTRRLAEQSRSMRALSLQVRERLELEATLRAKEQRLAGIIANAQQAIVTMTSEGVITCWNKQAEVTFGWTEEEALGRDLAELIVPADIRPMHVARLQRFVATGEGTLIGKTIEVQALHRSGARIPLELAINATRLSDGWEFTALLHDISERRKKAAQFENAFNYAPIGMALVSPSGAFLRVNAAFSKIVGYSADELRELDFRSLTHPADSALGLSEVQQLIARSISSFDLEKRYVHKSGRDVWVKLRVSLVEAEDGSPEHLIAQVEDMTSAREAENRYRLMATNTTDMITTTDLDGRITFTSSACQKILGLDPNDLVGARAFDFVHSEDLPRLRREYARLLRFGSADPVRWRGQRTDGEWVWLESSIGILREGHQDEPTGFIDVVRDVTERKKREDALDEARLSAEQAVQSKSDFVANVSHELRTPLNSIIGFSHLLTDAPELGEETRRRVKLIHSAGQALRGVIDNVLDFSKLEASSLELDCAPFDLHDFARETMALMEPQAAAKDVELRATLSHDVPRWVNGDTGRLRQVVLNLLSNAVKFTQEGVVTFTVWPVGRGGADRKLRFEVRDTGSGIPEERIATLFSRFVQASPGIAKHYGGTGLGLAISRQLVELMQGDMGVISKLGEGSTFWFEVLLPSASVTAGGKQVDGARGPVEFAGKRILVVDDVDLNRDLMLATLSRYNAEVFLATNGAEAVDAVLNGAYDLVLMDCQMPLMDGFTATRRIRDAGVAQSNVPIVALTASAQPAHLQRCTQAGMDDYLAKPLDERQLERALRRWLAQESRGAQALAPGMMRSPEPAAKLSLAERYANRKQSTLSRIEVAVRSTHIADDEADTLRTLAHQLAGTAGMFGEAALGELARELELGLEAWPSDERVERSAVLYQQLLAAAAPAA